MTQSQRTIGCGEIRVTGKMGTKKEIYVYDLPYKDRLALCTALNVDPKHWETVGELNKLITEVALS